MNEAFSSLVLLLVIIWPFVLAAGLSFNATRSVALRLTPWASLPALAVAGALADTSVRLPDVMLGSELALDSTGRIFLLVSAVLWLAVGLLARSQLRTADAIRFAVLLLLTMAGGFCTALAGDALLFFASSTLAGYGLYGLLVYGGDVPSQRAGRMLVILLVVSDLIVLELLLLLGQAAGTADFTSLRQALLNTDNRELMLGLLIIGFGIKLAVVGVHFWLAPVVMTAGVSIRPALISFMLTAGLLGWLRLLPLGDIHWTSEGIVLQWLVWVTLGYAVFVGLMQADFRSVMAYAAIALTGLWLAILGAVFQQPQSWHEIVDVLHAAVPQTGFALAALLLLDRNAGESNRAGLRYLYHAVMWLAALLLAAAPIGVTTALTGANSTAAAQMSWIASAISFLVVRSLVLNARTFQDSRDKKIIQYVVQQPVQASAFTILLVAAGLTVAATVAAVSNTVGLSTAEFQYSALMMSAAALAAWLSAARVVPRLPVLVSGDLPARISNRLAASLVHGWLLADTRLPLLRDAGMASLKRHWSNLDCGQVVERIESELVRWRTALTIFLLLGLLLVWWSGNG